jgi:aspartate racemase
MFIQESCQIDNSMPTIGVVGITIPGATDCINKMNRKCPSYFEYQEHPNIILHQLNFAPTYHAQTKSRFDIVEDRIMESIHSLNQSRADFVIIPANTAHKFISSIQSRSPVPIISMLDAVVNVCDQYHFKKVGIMGTRWTMAGHLYAEPLRSKNIQEIIPIDEDQEIIHKAIFEELIPTGRASDETISLLLGVVERLKAQDCECIALACTELPLVLNDQNCQIPVLDTTDILAEAAIREASVLKLRKSKHQILKTDIYHKEYQT